MKFGVDVDIEEFVEWVDITRNSFAGMIETMRNVAEVVRENTIPLTPFDEGYLSGSFKQIELTDNMSNKVIMVRMSALNKDTGYDYAWIQHENRRYRHPSPYSKHFDTYFDIATDNMLHNIGRTNNPDYHYLKDGIIQSEEGAFQLIEEDYISLFTRGHIF